MWEGGDNLELLGRVLEHSYRSRRDSKIERSFARLEMPPCPRLDFAVTQRIPSVGRETTQRVRIEYR